MNSTQDCQRNSGLEMMATLHINADVRKFPYSSGNPGSSIAGKQGSADMNSIEHVWPSAMPTNGTHTKVMSFDGSFFEWHIG